MIKYVCICSLVVPFKNLFQEHPAFPYLSWGVSPWRWSLRSGRPTLGGCSRRCCSGFMALLQTSLETFASGGQWYYGWRTVPRVDGLVGFTNNFLGIPWDLWQGFWEHLPGLLALHVLLYIFCSNDCYCILCLNYIVLSCRLHMHEYYTILFRHVHGYVAIYSMFMFVYVCLL